MKTIHDIDKIKAVVLYILKSFPEGVDRIKLFKIMYFAQQDNLVKYGKPIFDETFYALKHGPVPPFTYKCIQELEGAVFERTEELQCFNKSLDIRNSYIFMREEPDMDELSKSDIKAIDKAIQDYKDVNSYDLSDLSHNRAWFEAYTRSQDDPEKNRISRIEIARSGNATDDMIQYIKEKELLKRALF